MIRLLDQSKSKAFADAYLTISQTTILDSGKQKEFTDNNNEFDENGRELYNRVENIVGKGKIACYEQFLLFPQCLQKTLTADRACLGKG